MKPIVLDTWHMEDVEHLAAAGEPLPRIAARLGVKAGTIEVAIRRGGHLELMARRIRNAPTAEIVRERAR